MGASTDEDHKGRRAKGATLAARIAYWRAMSWEELREVMRETGPDPDAVTVSVPARPDFND